MTTTQDTPNLYNEHNVPPIINNKSFVRLIGAPVSFQHAEGLSPLLHVIVLVFGNSTTQKTYPNRGDRGDLVKDGSASRAGDVGWRGMRERCHHAYTSAMKQHTNGSESIEGCCC